MIEIVGNMNTPVNQELIDGVGINEEIAMLDAKIEEQQDDASSKKIVIDASQLIVEQENTQQINIPGQRSFIAGEQKRSFAPIDVEESFLTIDEEQKNKNA